MGVANRASKCTAPAFQMWFLHHILQQTVVLIMAMQFATSLYLWLAVSMTCFISVNHLMEQDCVARLFVGLDCLREATLLKQD